MLLVEEARACAKDQSMVLLRDSQEFHVAGEGWNEFGKIHWSKTVKGFKCYPRENGFYSTDGSPSFIIPNDLPDNNI